MKNQSSKPSNSVGIIGGGAWGLAIANTLSVNCESVLLYNRDKESANEINTSHSSNKVLQNIILSKNIIATPEIQKMVNNEILFICIPTQSYVDFFTEFKKLSPSKNIKFVLCSKGICNKHLKLPPEILQEILPNHKFAVLSGANFASEIILKKKSATTIAGESDDLLILIKNLLDTNFFTTELSHDYIGAALCGALKNIYAITCGIVQGLNIGENFRAFMLAKCAEELKLILEIFNCNPNTLFKQCGLADLLLSCTNTKSRNMSFGMQVVEQKDSIDNLLKATLVEGYFTTKSLVNLLKTKDINIPPIILKTFEIIYEGQNPDKITSLLLPIHTQ